MMRSLLLFAFCLFVGMSAVSTWASGQKKNTFAYSTNNHGWTNLELRLENRVFSIDTPRGDDTNSNRNMGFGGRPKLIMNLVRDIKSGNVTTVISKWRDELPDDYDGLFIYCKHLADVVENNELKFPTTFADAAVLFKDQKHDLAQKCPIKILAPKKFKVQVGAREMETYLSDMICQFPMNNELVSVYVPFERVETPTRPYQIDDPKDEIQMCIDDKVIDLNQEQL